MEGGSRGEMGKDWLFCVVFFLVFFFAFFLCPPLNQNKVREKINK